MKLPGLCINWRRCQNRHEKFAQGGRYMRSALKSVKAFRHWTRAKSDVSMLATRACRSCRPHPMMHDGAQFISTFPCKGLGSQQCCCGDDCVIVFTIFSPSALLVEGLREVQQQHGAWQSFRACRQAASKVFSGHPALRSGRTQMGFHL